MPVSKKRKKDGKKVQRRIEPIEPVLEDHQSNPKPDTFQERSNQPRNPFVTMQQQHRGAQRGR
jgi:hypothetical protein